MINIKYIFQSVLAIITLDAFLTFFVFLLGLSVSLLRLEFIAVDFVRFLWSGYEAIFGVNILMLIGLFFIAKGEWSFFKFK